MSNMGHSDTCKCVREIKQVIVMRKDLKMRRGKEMAQAGHASMKFLTDALKSWHGTQPEPDLSRVEWEWIRGSFKKIVVGVDSEEDLLRIDELAREAGISSNIITDNGATEFHGVATQTCLALGPDYAEKIDKITGGLKLL